MHVSYLEGLVPLLLASIYNDIQLFYSVQAKGFFLFLYYNKFSIIISEK